MKKPAKLSLQRGTKISDAELDQIEASGIYNEQGLRSVKISFRDQELNLMFTTGIPEKTHTVTVEDVYASFNYLLNMMDGKGAGDDIDHLGNRRLRWRR